MISSSSEASGSNRRIAEHRPPIERGAISRSATSSPSTRSSAWTGPLLSPKVAALLMAHEGGEEHFLETYDRLQPNPDEVGELVTLCGRMAGVKDQDILETLEQFLEARGR